jgi:prepilin-type N-terminal cleavage/methylation domain-containing protein
MREHSAGFTLVELMVTIAIVGVLLVMAGPLATNWVISAQTHAARTQLIEGFDVAKALALRNPNNVVLPSAAAGMSVTTDGTTTTVLVCTGSAAAATCVSGGTSVQWSTTYSGLVSTTINGVTAAVGSPLTLNFDNRAEPSTGTAFTLARGASGNNETGNLY